MTSSFIVKQFQPWSLSRRGAVVTRRIITAWRIIPALEISSSREGHIVVLQCGVGGGDGVSESWWDVGRESVPQQVRVQCPPLQQGRHYHRGTQLL